MSDNVIEFPLNDLIIMNKDNTLTPLEKVNLEVSDDVVKTELQSCRQDYFRIEIDTPKPILTML